MPLGFGEMFATCERSTALLRIASTAGPLTPAERQRLAGQLLPLLAELGDFADDHDIDDEPLCAVRSRLWEPAWDRNDDGFADDARRATERIGHIRTAVHVEGQRRLRAALLGI